MRAAASAVVADISAVVVDSAEATVADSAAVAATPVAARRMAQGPQATAAGRLPVMLQALPVSTATAAQQIPPRIRPRPPASSAAARGRLLQVQQCAAAPSPPHISSRPMKRLHPARTSSHGPLSLEASAILSALPRPCADRHLQPATRCARVPTPRSSSARLRTCRHFRRDVIPSTPSTAPASVSAAASVHSSSAAAADFTAAGSMAGSASAWATVTATAIHSGAARRASTAATTTAATTAIRSTTTRPATAASRTNSIPAATGARQLRPKKPAVAAAAASSSSDNEVVLFLKDGTVYAITDYWIADNKLHYITNYGGENSIPLDQLDMQRTVDVNAKRGINITLRPSPQSQQAAPAPDAQPAPGCSAAVTARRTTAGESARPTAAQRTTVLAAFRTVGLRPAPLLFPL